MDYKIGVNQQLITVSFPIPKLSYIVTNLQGSRYYCKIDLFMTYLHFTVDNQSATIQTITTHRGIFGIKRLSFGIKIAPAEFNRAMAKILSRLKNNTIAYYDDILVHAPTEQRCAQYLRECLQRLKEYDLHISL